MTEYTNEAIQVYETLCKMAEKAELKHSKIDESKTICCTIHGDDIPMDVNMNVDENLGVVLFWSRLPFEVSEDKRLDFAVAVSAVNEKLVDGCFDYDINAGEVFFRISTCYIGGTVSEEVLFYMLSGLCVVVDEYNDKFLFLSKGTIDLDKFIEIINK